MKELTLKAITSNIPTATAFIDAQLESLNCNPKAQVQIAVAIDELFVNIASYAYDGEPGDVVVRFEYLEDSRLVSITFIDSGIPFNPLLREDPDVTAPAEKRATGGLGIFIVKKTMDRMSYRYENGKNVLNIQKSI